MSPGDLLITLFYATILIIIYFAMVKYVTDRNKAKHKWEKLDDKIEEMRKVMSEKWDG